MFQVYKQKVEMVMTYEPYQQNHMLAKKKRLSRSRVNKQDMGSAVGTILTSNFATNTNASNVKVALCTNQVLLAFLIALNLGLKACMQCF